MSMKTSTKGPHTEKYNQSIHQLKKRSEPLIWTRKTNVPEPYPLEIISAARKRNEGDENARFHLCDPFFGFVLFHEHDRFDSSSTRRVRRGLSA